MNVLTVEDEPAMSGLLESALSEEGYAVTVVKNGRDALAIATEGRFDVIVLDLMLPGLDGFAVAQNIRRAAIQTPILVLTARDAPADIVRALDSGADDYLIKPFSLDVLLARVRAVSRRGAIPQPVCLEAGGLTLNTATREVLRGGRKIVLTPREYTLLEVLIRNKRRVLSRNSLIEAVWGFDAEIEDNTLEVFIRLLRNKVEGADLPKLIQTVRGIGYCLQEKDD
jgi:DNA-binding response OmpR family regulator